MTDPALGALHAGISSTFPFLKGTSLLEPQTRQVQRQDVFPFLEASDLVKIDIEGAEWEILADARFHRLASRALVLEYHPAYTPEPDPHQLVALALERGGYRVGRRRAGPDGVTIWAWKEPGPPD